MPYGRKIAHLYKTEYGAPYEVVLRFGAVAFAGVVLFFYTGWAIAWVWLGGFLAVQALYFVFLRQRAHVGGYRDYIIANVIFAGVIASFLWMPAYLLTQDDVAMVFSSGMGLFCMAIFLIWRADDLGVLIALEVATIAIAILAVTWHWVPRVEQLSAQLVMVFAALCAIAYFTIAILTSRKRRREKDTASERSLQSQKMEAVGQLAGGIAHDFNNILTAIQGNLELYHLADDAQDRDELIENAHSAAMRAAGLVRHLLAYSRNSPMIKKAVSVEAILEQLHQLTRRLIPSSIALEMEGPILPTVLLVDEDQLITALVNLIVNARDAMPLGGAIHVSVLQSDITEPLACADGKNLAPGPYISFSVADTGPGISPEIQAKVIEPFFTTKPVGKGSGLGLSMVLGFAVQSGGGLLLSSSKEGSTITIMLPFDDEIRAAP
ncbi:MAG: signal transduction histidine kinase [Halocynthiibacter sp.]|jgi:two-component system cell cycle sensor histidine kinase/response regulator CckA